LLILGAGVLGVCACIGFPMAFGFLSFFAVREEARVQHAQAVHAREQGVEVEMEAMKAAEKERAKKALELEKIEREIAEKQRFEEAELAKKKAEADAKPQHGEFKRLTLPQNPEVRALQFTLDGNSLFAATNTENVVSWDLKSWEMKKHPLDVPPGKGFGGQEVGAAAFSPKTDMVFFGRHGGLFTWYDLTKPSQQKSMQIGEPGRQIAFNHIAVSPDGTRICTCHGDSVAFVWDAATRAKVATVKDFRNQVFSAAFHPRAPFVAAGAEDVQMVDVNNGKKLDLKGGGPLSFRSLQFSRDGRFLTGVSGNTLYHWNMMDAKPKPVQRTYDQAGQHVAYSPDGTTLAVAVHFTRIYFYDAATLQQRFTIDMRNGANNWDSPHAIAFHPDSRRFAVARGATIYLFDLNNFEKK
jgi:WD40 repeat protein